jgi:mono/diheme cytochrome c family protein
MGCKACHGPGSAYGSILVRARGKPAEEIAKWILHPEQMRPGTLMPGYAKRLSQEQALALANWIKAGNPAPSR